MKMPSNAEYAVMPASDPIIIHWDNWPNDVGLYEPNFVYAMGFPHKSETDTKNGAFVLIRPEFRLYVNGEHKLSSICECHFKVVSKNGKPLNKSLIVGIINQFVHQWYSDEFLSRTGHKISMYYNLEEAQQELLDAAQRVLTECGW
jgi:hypothetical protein